MRSIGVQLATNVKVSSALPSLFPPPLEILARVSQGWVLEYRQHLITVMLSDVTPADSLQTTPNDLALMFTLSPDHQIHHVSATERGSSVQCRCADLVGFCVALLSVPEMRRVAHFNDCTSHRLTMPYADSEPSPLIWGPSASVCRLFIAALRQWPITKAA
jgi:hypothetical protein